MPLRCIGMTKGNQFQCCCSSQHSQKAPRHLQWLVFIRDLDREQGLLILVKSSAH